MKLLSDLMNTKISSSISELKKDTNEFLKTQIFNLLIIYIYFKESRGIQYI